MVVEDRALALTEVLRADGLVLLGARSSEHVPELVAGDDHTPVLRHVLETIAATVPGRTSAARRFLDALDDLPAFVGRRGRAWISELDDLGRVSVFWDDPDDWLEQGPHGVTPDVAMAWARRRTSDVRGPGRGR